MVIDDAEQPEADCRAIERMARGEVGAFGELYDRHARAMYSLALRIVSHTADAEEVVQDVFADVWRHSARYDRAGASVVGWLLTMTRGRAIDRLRARRSRPDARGGDGALPNIPATAANQESRVIGRRQRVQALEGAMGTLPDTLRAPIELAFYEGLSHAAIAERLGEPLGTIKTRMRSALARLCGALARTVCDDG